ncbi:MAG: Rpn family recombination-promoting nuclease/putative transposase [Clostridia bacterium]|nr:Rpn family recombination-promoting nuclease/putative transposase [Clostridia bacterium]
MENLKPTNDFVFKKLFGAEKNVDILKDLIQAILPDLSIHTIKINKDVSLERKFLTDKLGILDIIAELNDNSKINIEMQVENIYNTIDRSLFYNAGLHHESLKKGESYNSSFKTIGIWITNFDVFETGPFHEIAKLKRDYENTILTNKFELHYIQLTKFKAKCKRISTKLDQWLTFIINEKLEEIKMVDNEYIKKAEEELEYLSGDEETKRLAFLRDKAIRDEISLKEGAKEEGRREGIQKGKKEANIEIAKKMLENNIEISIISKITELSEEEILKLK